VVDLQQELAEWEVHRLRNVVTVALLELGVAERELRRAGSPDAWMVALVYDAALSARDRYLEDMQRAFSDRGYRMSTPQGGIV
jgi:hypothetical protein